jgi:hypothetical protein
MRAVESGFFEGIAQGWDERAVARDEQNSHARAPYK